MRDLLLFGGAVIAALALAPRAGAQTAMAAGQAPSPRAPAAAGPPATGVLAPGPRAPRSRGGVHRQGRARMGDGQAARSAMDRGQDAAAIGASHRTELDSVDSTALGDLRDAAAAGPRHRGGAFEGTSSDGSQWSSPGGFTSPFPKGPAPGPWSGR